MVPSGSANRLQCSLTPHSNQIKTEHRSGHQPGTVLVPDYIELDAVVKFEVTVELQLLRQPEPGYNLSEMEGSRAAGRCPQIQLQPQHLLQGWHAVQMKQAAVEHSPDLFGKCHLRP